MKIDVLGSFFVLAAAPRLPVLASLYDFLLVVVHQGDTGAALDPLELHLSEYFVEVSCEDGGKKELELFFPRSWLPFALQSLTVVE